jgi:hypothetical protein
MCLHAFADELSSCGKDEIAFYSLPYEMKLVMVKPHIRARTVDGVFLPFGIVPRRAVPGNIADIILSLKHTEGFRLGKGYRWYREIYQGEYNGKAGNQVFHRHNSPDVGMLNERPACLVRLH